MKKLQSILKLIRPHQYVKNAIIFFPLFFVGQISDNALLINAAIAFFAFSITASAVYILNDYKDIEQDRLHPTKRNRPLASGTVSQFEALILMVILVLAGGLLMYSLSVSAFYILCLYVVMNIFYCFKLKHVAIIDVVIISIGFVLRLFIGSYVTGIPLSMWIVLMGFLLALFLALAKRRDDVLIYLDTGKKMRKVVDGYNLQIIDGSMMIMASVVIVSYIMYTMSAEVIERLNTEYLYLTTLFVILGILRYMQITLLEKKSGSPTKVVFKDIFMQITIACWILAFIWIIYVNN